MLDGLRFGSAVCGIALLGYGGWLHYPPLGLMIAGGLLFLLGLLGALRAR